MSQKSNIDQASELVQKFMLDHEIVKRYGIYIERDSDSEATLFERILIAC